MAGKALNKANLVQLGPDVLADLLLDVAKGDSARQRKIRMALAAGQGPEAVAADIRKRFASLRRARCFIRRKAQQKLAKELAEIVALIETRVAPDAPDMAFDLYWAQLHLAEAIHERTDDSWGTIADAMHGAVEALGRVAPRLTRDPKSLADDIFDAITQDGYGAFDYVVQALAPALGDDGITHLKTLAEGAATDHSAQILLKDIADLQGDVDAWLAGYTAEQLSLATIAPEAATRLLEAGRAEEALALIETSRDRNKDSRLDPRELDDVHFACLDVLGRTDALRDALWQRFEARLCPDALRHHLKLLPDFEDIEAEDAARRIVLAFHPIERALVFCLTAPDLTLAAELIDHRFADIDGDAFEILTPLAEALQAAHPLQAVLLWRAMIKFALARGRSGRYGHAARHLMDCAAADLSIADYGPHDGHADYVDALMRSHARKTAFWGRTDLFS